jgi:hypothetical protein
VYSGDCYTGKNFGNFQLGSIGDTIYIDSNSNATQDVGEPGISGVTVFLYLGSIDPLNLQGSKVTDAVGYYVFTGLGPGTYYVDVDDTTIPSGYSLTTANDPVSVTMTSGLNFDAVDFGYVPPSITTGGGPTPTPSLVTAGITTEKHKAAGIEVAGITELPFTGSNMLIVYAIAILMIASGTAILSTTKKTRKNRA